MPGPVSGFVNGIARSDRTEMWVIRTPGCRVSWRRVRSYSNGGADTLPYQLRQNHERENLLTRPTGGQRSLEK